MGTTALVLGGARSGKSAFAERWVRERGGRPTYLATGRAWDDEMRERITRHRADRGDVWETVEEPVDLVGALRRVSGPVLVDCLTLWLTNLMMAERDVEAEGGTLVAALAEIEGDVAFVSNEVGQGIVPADPMSRAFRDHAGRLHQRLAAAVDEVHFVTAGIAQRLK